MDLNYETMRYLGNGLAIWATIIGLGSVILHARVDWRSSQMGRHLMFYMGAIEAVFILSCIRMLIGDSWQFQLVRLIVFALVPLAMTQRFWLQLKAQRDVRADNYTAVSDQSVQLRAAKELYPRHARDEETGQ